MFILFHIKKQSIHVLCRSIKTPIPFTNEKNSTLFWTRNKRSNPCPQERGCTESTGDSISSLPRDQCQTEFVQTSRGQTKRIENRPSHSERSCEKARTGASQCKPRADARKQKAITAPTSTFIIPAHIYIKPHLLPQMSHPVKASRVPSSQWKPALLTLQRIPI